MRRGETGESQALHGALKDAQTGFWALAAITAEFSLLCHLEASQLHTDVYRRVLCAPWYHAVAR